MATGGWLRKKISLRLFLCLAGLMAAVCFGVYEYTRNSLPAGGDALLHDEGNNPVNRLNQVNQELSARISRLQEEMRLISEERDRLKEDKVQLLYMVEKLQQQSIKPSTSGPEAGVSEKIVRSWLLRITELRNVKTGETTASRDAYVKEVNEVLRGIKEDFAADTFIMDIGYVKTSSRVKGDITAAQKKLDAIIKYLYAYSSAAD